MSGSRFVEVGGARLFYEVAGDGPAVVLVHAGIADSRMWDPQVEALLPRHTVLRLDLRGFGRSTLPPGSYSLYRDVAEVMRAAGVSRASVVGASMGGSVALELTLAEPQLVDRLVLVAPGLPDHERSGLLRQFARDEEDALERGDLDRAIELNLRTWVDGPTREPDEVDATVRSRVAEMQRDAFALQLPAYDAEQPPGPHERLEPPASARLDAIGVPTLIVVGDGDVPDMIEISERLERGIPGARRVVIPGVAHLPTMERARDVNQLLLEFLGNGHE